MSEEIVTRLRNYDFMRDGDTPEVIMGEAADEIEYLRKDRDKWKRLAIENDKIAQIQAGIYPPIPHYEEVNKHE